MPLKILSFSLMASFLGQNTVLLWPKMWPLVCALTENGKKAEYSWYSPSKTSLPFYSYSLQILIKTSLFR